jgi:hypothetical protein
MNKSLTLLLIATIAASGCAQANQQEITPPSKITEEEAIQTVLRLEDLRTLEFHRNNLKTEQLYNETYKENTEKRSISSDFNFTDIEASNLSLNSPFQILALSTYPSIAKNRIATSKFRLEPENEQRTRVDNVPVDVTSSVYHYNNPGQAIKGLDKTLERDREVVEVLKDRKTPDGRTLVLEDFATKFVIIRKRHQNIVMESIVVSNKEAGESEAEQVIRKMNSRLDKQKSN